MDNKQAMIEEIKALAKEKNAIILAHNYQIPEIQDLADLTGDSLALSIQASKTDADIIVFCGVHFMAEAASIVCPDKKVIIPVKDAGCAMADMLTAQQLREFKAQHPGVPVVTYVNSSAEVKAESDICCTSANAIQVVKWTKSQEVIMTPDRNLAAWVRRHTDQTVYSWNGYCPIHDELTVEAVREAMKKHPDAILMAHPECPETVLELAHVVRSTSGMLKYAKESDAKKFIVATEIGLLHPLKKENPDKEFFEASPDMLCADMKKTGLKELLAALKNEEPVVRVEEDVRKKALKAVERMMEVPRD
ncbi:MAG: quinolinate synthase NadA [Thermodesulfobacteria bacterium]|nr:quinolinate synthase NadA [Thermodesulfobacteriota bacterium]